MTRAERQALRHRGGGLYRWPARQVLFAVGAAAVVSVTAALQLPLWVPVTAAMVVLASFLIPFCRRSGWVLCGLAAAVFLLATAGHRYLWVRPLEALSGQTDTVTGWVAAEPTTGSMYTVEVTEAGQVPVGTRLLLYCPEEYAPSLHDTVSATVELRRLYDSQQYRRAQGIHLCAFPTDYGEEAIRVVRGTGAPVFSRSLWPLRESLTATLRGVLPDEEGAVLAALCLGDRSGLSEERLDTFSASGISHVLVVSGLHLTMIVGAVLVLLRFCGRRIAALLTIPVVLVFMLFIGGTPSVMRAGIMCLVWLMGRLLRQRADALNSIGLAALCLLLYELYVLFSAGFQLSFAATAGVVTLTRRLCPTPAEPVDAGQGFSRLWRRLRSYAGSSAAVCIAATIPTLPLVCYYYGGFPLTTVLTNLLAVPAGTAALLVGWLGILLCAAPCLYPLGRVFLLAAGGLARYLSRVSEWCAAEGTFLRIDSLWALLLVAGSCILLIYGLLARVSPRRMLVCLLALTVLTVGVGLPLTRRVPRVEISAAGSGAALLLRLGGRAALLVSHGDGLADAAYRVEGLDLDLLFVGDGDAADGGALADLIRDTEAACIYTTASDGWTAGIPHTVNAFYSGDELRLWGRFRLSVPARGWWRLETEEASLLICTDLSAPPPESADGMVVYAGGLSRQPMAAEQSVLVCSEQWLATARPESVDRRAVLTDQSVTFTPRSTGEWSVLPWL